MSRNHKKNRNTVSKSRSQSVASNDLEEIKDEGSKSESTFSVKTSKVMGRYMVATKDLKPGSVILCETPLVVGPCTGSRVSCIACYQVLEPDMNYFKCDTCGWPLCSKHCSSIGKEHGHSKTECAVLKECRSNTSLDYGDFAKLSENYNALMPLRCLVLKESDPRKYEKILTMETHNAIRRNIPDIWNLNQTGIVDKIRKEWGLVEFSENEIHSICGILEVNCFEIGQQGVSIRGLYPTAFLLSHDCIPNTNHCDEEQDYKLTIRASTPISENERITLSYSYTLQSTLKRREHLLENKFFECQCNRCADPTELGTYSGALICPKCPTGLVLSTNPLNADANWKCCNIERNRCPGYTMTAKSMQLLLDRVSSEADSLDCNDIKGMENFLLKYRNVLHPNHYLFLGIKLSLSQLYGKINEFLIHELSDDMLQRKMEICKELVKVLDIIEPGYTRVRGVTLYELHAPIMILTSRQFECELISASELKQKLKEVVRYLEEASIILGFEPIHSSEGMMGIAAKEALLKIKEWRKIIGKL